MDLHRGGWIRPEQLSETLVRHRIVEDECPVAVRERRCELRKEELGDGKECVAQERLLGVAAPFGRRQYVGKQHPPLLDRAAVDVEEADAPPAMPRRPASSPVSANAAARS